MSAPAIAAQRLGYRYRGAVALRDFDLEVGSGELVGLIGPDGVGKSTLLALAAGVRRLQAGGLEVLGGSIRDRRHRARICHLIGYLPQGLGPHLYAELTAEENLRFFGRLFGLDAATVRDRGDRLLAATGLGSAGRRPVGQLSGGMRQKVGLCCALLHQPRLLLLDEPTTGIDPLSRRQFWDLIAALRRTDPELTVLAASAYPEEAEGFDRVLMVDAGSVIASGTPAELRTATGTDSLDAAYVALLSPDREITADQRTRQPRTGSAEEVVVAAAVTRRYGTVTAVDAVSFAIQRGEIFGFVGPNGSGKTTLLMMVTGLTSPTGGRLLTLGAPVAAADRQRRRRIGYMSQGFSLYGELTVLQNLRLHARLYGVTERSLPELVRTAVDRFQLESVRGTRADDLPLGVRQRLSLAAATIHGPELLILDEPTSGVDPVARDRFWTEILRLSRENGTTVLVSTHYLAEASRCDRIALMDQGRLVACDEPSSIAARHPGGRLEDAFVALVSQNRPGEPIHPAAQPARTGSPPVRTGGLRESGSRLRALIEREAIEILRDRFRLFWAVVVPMLLLVVFGSGLALNIDRLPFAVLDRDQTPESREYLDLFRGSSYFAERQPVADDATMERALRLGSVRLAIEIPNGLGRDLRRGRPTEIGLWIDGTMPYRAETVRGYAEAVHTRWVGARQPVKVEPRYWFNQALTSQMAFVPALVAVILLLMPATLTAIAAVREKENGSIVNLSATPATPFEFLLAKQIPYAALGLVSLATLVAVVRLVFGIPLPRHLGALAVTAVPFLFAGTGLGIVVAGVTRSQTAAVFVTMIIVLMPSFQYSGLLSPVAALTGGAQVFARIFPTSYFVDASVGVIVKDARLADLAPDIVALSGFAVLMTVVGRLLLRKQLR